MSVSSIESPPQTREQAVDRARALFPLFREGARAADDARHLPREMVEAFVRSGLVRTQVPARFGGTELGLTAHYEIAVELGRAYGSMGWVGSFLIDHPFVFSHFNQQAQEDVWSVDGPDALIGTSFVPVGRVEPADGGWRLSGDWAWASGIEHCQWVLLGGVVQTADGEHQFRLFLLPTSEIEIVDTWYSAGLSGSGSDNVVVKDVFVPEHHTLYMQPVIEGHAEGAAIHANPMYTKPFMTYGGHAMVAPAVGIARGVVEAWQDHVRTKANSYTQEQVAGALPMQLVLAESATKIDCADLLVRRALTMAESDHEVTLEDRVRNRRDITYATRLLVSAVNELMGMAGASALRSESPIQRGWRDVRAVACHVFCNFNAAGENYGRMAFGFPLNPRDPFH
ncbi:MAG: acyl-CoA dehydrogenase family protein [Solirubrobacteraceae bacterium]